MKIAKKPKKQPKPQKEPMEILMMSNYLNFSIFMIMMHDMYRFRKKRLLDVFEGYLALMQEVADKRITVNMVVADAKKITGLDIKEMLDYVNAGNYEAWKKGLKRC